MDQKNKKLVMFDFDGVLVDTLFINHKIYEEVNEELSLDEFKSFYHGNKFKAKRFDGSDRCEHPNRCEKYDFHTRELKVPEIFKDIVKELSLKYILSIISSTHSSSIEKIIKRDGLGGYFSDILGVEVDKSKVKKIKMLLDKYGVDKDNSVYITDTLGDICEAGECSVPSVGVLWGYHDKETLKKGNPAQIIDDPKDLIGAIDNVLK